MTYTVDYFIAKFEAIPEEKWPGDLLVFLNANEVGALLELIGWFNEIDRIEDPQPTPKQRILAALRDVKGVVG